LLADSAEEDAALLLRYQRDYVRRKRSYEEFRADLIVEAAELTGSGKIVVLGEGTYLAEALARKGIAPERLVVMEPRGEVRASLYRRFRKAEIFLGDPQDRHQRERLLWPRLGTRIDAIFCGWPMLVRRGSSFVDECLRAMRGTAPLVYCGPAKGRQVLEGESWVTTFSPRICVNVARPEQVFALRKCKWNFRGAEGESIKTFDAFRPMWLSWDACYELGVEISTEEEITKGPGVDRLPETPPRLWPRAPRGRPWHRSHEAELHTFIEQVYGPYIAAGFRDQLRGYIFRNDKALYAAIARYEFAGHQLPEAIALPTRDDLVMKRLKKAAESGFKSLSRPERRSVTGKLKRSERKLTI
jgi:phospholipid N-methyltransferase